MIKEMKPSFLERNFIIPFLKNFLIYNSIDSNKPFFYRRKVFRSGLSSIRNETNILKIIKIADKPGMQNIVWTLDGCFIEDPIYVILEKSYNNEINKLTCSDVAFLPHTPNDDHLIEIDVSDQHAHLEFGRDEAFNMLSCEILENSYCESIIEK